MLAGRWATPTLHNAPTDPISLGGLSVSSPLILQVPVGSVALGVLAAAVQDRTGRPPVWVRLAPYELDEAGLGALARAAGSGSGAVTVVEGGTRAQALRFVDVASPTAEAIMLPEVPRRRDRRLAAACAPLGPERVDLLTAGRPELRRSMLAVAPRLVPGELDLIARDARRYGDLTRAVAARLLDDVGPSMRTVLDFAALLGVAHPRLATLAPAVEIDGPWWTECTNGWWRFEPVWRAAVHAVCRSDGHPDVVLLGRLLAELLEAGAIGAAIELCLDAGYAGTASDLIAGAADDLLAAAQPLALARWLRRLPRAERRRRRLLAVHLRTARRALWRPGSVRSLALSVPAVPASNGHRPRPTARPGVEAILDVRLLGTFDVVLCGQPVPAWHGRKGPLLLAYLLLNRDRMISRDTLAVVFWPDASPASSRNRLHVAFHALRADLRTAGSMPVVVFDHGYRINPDLRVTLDTEMFDSSIARAEDAEDGGGRATALAEYRRAVNCYRGDLLAGYPYEDWTLLPRQRFRVRLLDTLGRAAHLEFDAGRYVDSVAHARHLLELDFFREDLHRLLMRSYCRLGRPHLAIRQFDECSRQLGRELGIEPDAETVDLYRRVRERASV